MKIIILGFASVTEIDKVMQPLIEKSQCFLFTVVCGGLDERNLTVSMGEQWARNNGAPIEYLFCENPEKMVDLLAWKCDYIVLKLNDNSPKWHKDLLMKMRAAGKHGTVIRCGCGHI